MPPGPRRGGSWIGANASICVMLRSASRQSRLADGAAEEPHAAPRLDGAADLRSKLSLDTRHGTVRDPPAKGGALMRRGRRAMIQIIALAAYWTAATQVTLRVQLPTISSATRSRARTRRRPTPRT